ncbi:MAG TPA: glycosyltransferase [Stenotrophomonas sp.]|jgi:glycosyltransferase involved in cell wall biosynthesis
MSGNPGVAIGKRQICHIIEAAATGTLAMASLLANLQSADGHEVTVVYSRRPETPLNLRDYFSPSVKLLHLPMRSATQKALALLAIRRRVRAERPDALFLHSSFAGFIGRLATAGLGGGLRVFYLPHCISFMRRDISAFKRALFVTLERVAALRASTYLACSESERAEIARRIPSGDCVLVENAVELTVEPRKSCAARPRLSVTTIGQIRAQKDPTRFAQIAERLRQQDVPMDFAWIGDGDAIQKAELMRAGVEVTGWLAKPAVMQRLRDSDVYLSTALWEGMPVALIEAQLSGVPVVASRCAGNLDCVEDGKTGWLYDTVEEAVQILVQLCREREPLKLRASLAVEAARKRFGEERYRTQMARLVA